MLLLLTNIVMFLVSYRYGMLQEMDNLLVHFLVGMGSPNVALNACVVTIFANVDCVINDPPRVILDLGLTTTKFEQNPSGTLSLIVVSFPVQQVDLGFGDSTNHDWGQSLFLGIVNVY